LRIRFEIIISGEPLDHHPKSDIFAWRYYPSGLNLKSMEKHPRVALLIETSGSYGRDALAGISEYSRAHGPWSFYVLPRAHEQSLPDMKSWRPTGIIARIESKAAARVIANAGVPVVGLDVSPEVLLQLRQRVPASEIHPDARAAARMAGDHLLERGFRSFAFVGVRDQVWSQERQHAFVNHVLGQHKHPCEVFNFSEVTRAQEYGADQKKLIHWLRQLPKPLGLMACNDDCAREVLDAAIVAAIPVPDEIGVIGMDNDSVLCDLCNPPLTSVIPNAHRAGYEAAVLLHRMMEDRNVPGQTLLLEPSGVTTRQSTDVVAIDDRQVAMAVRFIREHAAEKISVEDVLKAVPLSRTLLERRFKHYLRRTPHEQILHERIGRVKLLLTTTDLTLAAVAERSGFDHVEYLSVVIKRLTGKSPSQFRNEHLRKTSVGRA
jgi:LacI family transcriptional regulator